MLCKWSCVQVINPLKRDGPLIQTMKDHYAMHVTLMLFENDQCGIVKVKCHSVTKPPRSYAL